MMLLPVPILVLGLCGQTEVTGANQNQKGSLLKHGRARGLAVCVRGVRG